MIETSLESSNGNVCLPAEKRLNPAPLNAGAFADGFSFDADIGALMQSLSDEKDRSDVHFDRFLDTPRSYVDMKSGNWYLTVECFAESVNVWISYLQKIGNPPVLAHGSLNGYNLLWREPEGITIRSKITFENKINKFSLRRALLNPQLYHLSLEKA
ncbi:hypothetical protein HYU14_07585 [Candidatus Woesearchaeota archaeon]|nr:hypothetical protein [Candidatus Woesearchaeota archaeon]